MSDDVQTGASNLSLIGDWEAAADATSDVVDITARDLPGLKAAFAVEHVADGSVVLDVGCGGGKMLRTIRVHRPGVTLLGCDIKEPADINGEFAFTALDRSTGLLHTRTRQLTSLF